MMIEWFEGSRAALADLFALADDSPKQVERYRDIGRVLVARDGLTVIGHLQLIPGERANETEVKSLAVRKDRQRSGIGRSLMNRAIATCREEDCAALLVATATAETGVLRFYQRFGFWFLRVERDVFTPEAGYPATEVDGVPVRDQIWLSLTLDGSRPRPGATELRVARHTERLDELIRFYRDGLGLVEVGGFPTTTATTVCSSRSRARAPTSNSPPAAAIALPRHIQNRCSCSTSRTNKPYKPSPRGLGSDQ
jgi:GNAT superfamily N-acetyltransferase